MLSLSAKVTYGVQLLRSLKRRGRRAPPLALQALAGELHLPYRYLAQIARQLRRAGLVESFDGVNGGYRLAKAPTEISLGTIMAALESQRPLMRCLRQDQPRRCPCGGACGAQAWWRTLEARFQRELRHLTLAKLS